MNNRLWDKSLKELLLDLKNRLCYILRVIYLLLYWLVIATIPIFLLYKWNFQHAAEINRFLQYAIWPLVTILLALYFEKEIKEALKNVKKAKTPFVDLEFSQQNEQIDQSTEEKKKIKELEDKLKLTGEKYSEEIKKIKDNNLYYFLNHHFERTYRLIFGSQLAILSTISNSSDNKITEQLVQLFHKNSTFHSTYPFDQYINFLINMSLIQLNDADRTYSLTLIGSLFLGYLKKENINPNKLPF